MIDPIELLLLAAALSRPDDELREIRRELLEQGDTPHQHASSEGTRETHPRRARRSAVQTVLAAIAVLASDC